MEAAVEGVPAAGGSAVAQTSQKLANDAAASAPPIADSEPTPVAVASTPAPPGGESISVEPEADSAEPAPSVERNPLDALDDTLDRALGQAASGLWSFAARVQSAVPPEAGARLAGLREGAAPKLGMLAAGMKDVVGSVQRNAVAMEEALLDAAQSGVGAAAGSLNDLAGAGAGDGEGAVSDKQAAIDAVAMAEIDAVGFVAATGRDLVPDGADGGNGERDLRTQSPGNTGGEDGVGGSDSTKLLPSNRFGASAGYIPEDLDVNAELARAAQTLRSSVAPVGKTVKDTVGGLFGTISDWAAGGADDSEPRGGDSPGNARDAPLTRFEGLVRDLEVNPDTYCEPPVDLDAFEKWTGGFDLDKLENKCVALLDRRPAVADLYERVVPHIIEENTFWMRYFFARDTLDRREQERMKLLQRAVGGATGDDDETGGWDDDDDDDDEDGDNEQDQCEGGSERHNDTGGHGDGDDGDGKLHVDIAPGQRASEENVDVAGLDPGSQADLKKGGTESSKPVEAAEEGNDLKPPEKGADAAGKANADSDSTAARNTGATPESAKQASHTAREEETDDDSDDWE